jgi:uroporphyrinogen decarboxylase
MMNARENWLRAVEFRYPRWIPCRVVFSPLTWKKYRVDLEKIVLEHPRIFPDFQPGSVNYDFMPPTYQKGEYYRDHWGCLWYNTQEGLEGQVVEHPLENWDALKSYQAPDPTRFMERGERDWNTVEEVIQTKKDRGELTWGDGERLFDRLYFLRGFENLMLDFADEPPELFQLLEMLEEYEMKLVRRWLQMGVDVVSFHTDFATQVGTMISPAKFRKILKPMFMRLFQAIRESGTHVFLSSDGRVLEVVDDLIECGVTVHDPQLRANTLQGIFRVYKGRLCADVDLDRQGFPFMSPLEIRSQVKEVVDALALPEGGLMMLAAVYGDDVPLKNIAAICEAMNDYCLDL